MNLKKLSIALLSVSFLLSLHLTLYAQTSHEKLLWPLGIKDNQAQHGDVEEVVNFGVDAFSLSKMNRVFRKVSIPTYVLHLPSPEKATGVAVVICPGGGFVDNWFDREGTDLALWLKERGVASLVLLLCGTFSSWQTKQEFLPTLSR